MVLCMIPTSFAAGNNISYGSTQYDLYFFDYQKADITNNHWADLSLLADKSGVNTLTVEYNYETLKDDTTGQFNQRSRWVFLRLRVGISSLTVSRTLKLPLTVLIWKSMLL